MFMRLLLLANGTFSVKEPLFVDAAEMENINLHYFEDRSLR
jgi:hypothetical protein